MPIPHAPHAPSIDRYSSRGWDDPWAHTPSYFRPYYVEYAAPREPSRAGQLHNVNDHFKIKNWSRMLEKKKVVKQIYIVKRDGRKDTSSDLNTIDEKPINVSKTSAISDKGKGELSDDIPSVKSEKSKFKGPKINKEVLLSKDGVQPRCPLSTSNWQKRNLQKLSIQELKERKMVWVPKGSVSTQDKDDDQANGAMQLKKKRRSRRRSSNMRFAPNHQNYWSVHPFDSQMPYMPMSWNSSLDMYAYPSYSYFDPWMPYGSLYHGGLSPN
ncbi:hypothetical protein PVAP13_7KG186500 [Panicum virgatum]|uniref:Uncharacterized protein n=1 Tax=Panicum virgatum TaxID=38727 RepID=A0A8T0QCD3_PANVG|nr:hypothetical protein PVAP13_7KG186500 [Panicum virgatum]